jgi:hypothetical protein
MVKPANSTVDEDELDELDEEEDELDEDIDEDDDDVGFEPLKDNPPLPQLHIPQVKKEVQEVVEEEDADDPTYVDLDTP